MHSLTIFTRMGARSSPQCVRPVEPQVKSIEMSHNGRRAPPAYRHRRDHDIGGPAVFGQGAFVMYQGDGVAPHPVDASLAVAGERAVATGPGGRPNEGRLLLAGLAQPDVGVEAAEPPAGQRSVPMASRTAARRPVVVEHSSAGATHNALAKHPAMPRQATQGPFARHRQSTGRPCVTATRPAVGIAGSRVTAPGQAAT